MRTERARQGGDLEIVEETEMLSVTRGKSDAIKLRFVRARTADGKAVAWHDLRLFSGDRPTQKGLSLRGGELAPLIAALTAATSGARPAAASGAPAPRAPVSARETAARAGDGPRAAFGRSKGELLVDLSDDDLRWLAGALQRSVSDPSKAAYRRKNEADLAAIRAELSSRGAASAPTEPMAPEGTDDGIPF
jgi:hypothetical protein